MCFVHSMAWPSSLCYFSHFLQNFVSSSGTSILLRSHIAHCDGSRVLTVVKDDPSIHDKGNGAGGTMGHHNTEWGCFMADLKVG